jgi:hypothetical protein
VREHRSGWNNKIMGREGIVEREGRRTVVILGEPEGVPRPYGEKLVSIAAKSIQHHIIDAVGLRRAPDHDVQPSARPRREKIRAERGEIGAGHDAAGRGVLMASAAVGLGSARGAEEEGAIEIQNEELARRLGERFGGRRRGFEVGGRRSSWWRLLGVVV